MKSRRKFGVEIEFCTDEDIYSWADMLRSTTGIPVSVYGGSYDYDGWKLVVDGSVDGWEFVSPILRGDEGMAQVKKMVKALKKHGATMDNSCGLHVHVNARDFSFANLMDAMKRYDQNERVIDQAVTESRREYRNHYAEPMAGYIEQVAGMAKSKKQLRSILEDDGYGSIERYAKLNICSYVKHGTLEFRHHEGTLDVRKITSWINFCVRFMDDIRAKKKFRAPTKARVHQTNTSRSRNQPLASSLQV